MSQPNTTRTPFTLAPERQITVPAALFVSLLTIAAVGYAAWSSTRDQVQRNTSDLVEVKREAAAAREILIRIDENVKELKRQQRTAQP